VEQGEIDAYADSENAGTAGPTGDERQAYLRARYEQIKIEYKSLQLQQEEYKCSKRDELVQKVREAFGHNYAARKYVVRELRKVGEKIEDKFVPLSA
jgi:hypothetical protein